MNPAGKNALVLGLGETGLSMARFLSRRGAHVRVADTNAEQEEETQKSGFHCQQQDSSAAGHGAPNANRNRHSPSAEVTALGNRAIHHFGVIL